MVGAMVGIAEGDPVCSAVGLLVGSIDGLWVGVMVVGFSLGVSVGYGVGSTVVGLSLGNSVGDGVA